MHQIIINGASEAECRHLLADAKAQYGIKSADSRTKTLDLKMNAESDILESIGNSNRSNGLVSESGSKVFKYAGGGSDLSEFNREKVTGSMHASLALIIDGNILVYTLERDLEPELFDLATSCRVVLCCHVALLQKAGIVDLIKSRTNDMTLAIGDGNCS